MRSRKQCSGIPAVLGLLALAGFGCQDQTNLAGFTDSGCKKEMALTALGLGLTNADLDGLQCIQWETKADEAMTVTLVNFPDACGPEWEGDAIYQAPDTLLLTVDNPGCMIAGCGSCIYDWTFEVTGVEAVADLKLRMEANDCPGEDEPETWTYTIPKDRRDKGTVCRYLEPGVLGWVGECGTLHGVCRTDPDGLCGDGDEGDACDPGLVCGTDAGLEDAICFEPCSEDSDCPLEGLLACQESICRLKETW